MTEDLFVEVAPIAWNLLLESDRELSACAASLFILAAVKSPNTASSIMSGEMKDVDPGTRYIILCLYLLFYEGFRYRDAVVKRPKNAE